MIVLQAYYKECKVLKKEENEKYSLRCTQLYTLSLANSLDGAPFWQCYNLDFRGRVYPIAPHFSQMLGDHARGKHNFNGMTYEGMV
jgi:DNA-directed RNA polymerase